MSKLMPVSMRLDQDDKADLQAMADEENRSLSNMMESILKKAIGEWRAKRKGKK